MIRLGLVGYPLGHSLSPILHEAALRAAGLQGQYLLYPIHPSDADGLRDLVNRVRTGELNGLNVTIPYKRTVIPLLDELTPAARAIGAVNTIFLKGGKIIGDNTDAPGFLAELDAFLPRPRSAIVLGAGGGARAIVYSLWRKGWEVRVAARRIEQAEALEGMFANVKAMELSARTLRETHTELILNATPVGMLPNIESCPWPASVPFPRNAAVYDLVYNPPETQLLKMARAAELRAKSGMGMLIEQAALAFELWTECRIPRQLLKAAIEQAGR